MVDKSLNVELLYDSIKKSNLVNICDLDYVQIKDDGIIEFIDIGDGLCNPKDSKTSILFDINTWFLDKKSEKYIDIDLDWKPEKVFLKKTMWEEQEDGSIDYIPVKHFVFDNPNIPKIKTSNCAKIDDLFSIGNIDEDGSIELGMYYSGCTWI